MVNINYSISVKDRIEDVRKEKYKESGRYTPIDTGSMKRMMSQETLDTCDKALKILHTIREEVPSLKSSVLQLLNYDDVSEETERPIVNHYGVLLEDVSIYYFNKINSKAKEFELIAETFRSSETRLPALCKKRYEKQLLKLRGKYLPKCKEISTLYDNLQTNLTNSLNNMRRGDQIDLSTFRDVMSVLRSALLELHHSGKLKPVQDD